MVGLALFIIVVGGFICGFYIYISKKSGTIYQELAGTRVIDNAGTSVRNLVLGSTNSIYTRHNRRLWLSVAVCLMLIAVIITLYVQILDPNVGEITKYRSFGVFISMPVWITGIYMVVMIVTRSSVTIWGLFRVLRVNQVEVHPLHPDRCGGLRPLRDYALALSYLIAVFGVGIVLFGFLTSQGPDPCVSQLKEERVVRLQDDCDGRLVELKTMGVVVATDEAMDVVDLLIDTTELEKAAKKVQTNLDRTFSLAPMWIFAILYVILAPSAFFGTLWVAHGPMQRVKSEFIQNLSVQFNEEYKIVHGQLGAQPEVPEDRFENLRRIRELHGITEAFPVWPWDSGSIGRFMAANTPAVALAGAGFLANRFFI